MRTDCKFYATDGPVVPCRATIYNRCKGEHCAFYVTEAQAKEAQESAHARLRSLTEDEQSYIADKYYRGRLVWQ
jgi:hypothetical protein